MPSLFSRSGKKQNPRSGSHTQNLPHSSQKSNNSVGWSHCWDQLDTYLDIWAPILRLAADVALLQQLVQGQQLGGMLQRGVQGRLRSLPGVGVGGGGGGGQVEWQRRLKYHEGMAAQLAQVLQGLQRTNAGTLLPRGILRVVDMKGTMQFPGLALLDLCSPYTCKFSLANWGVGQGFAIINPPSGGCHPGPTTTERATIGGCAAPHETLDQGGLVEPHMHLNVCNALHSPPSLSITSGVTWKTCGAVSAESCRLLPSAVLARSPDAEAEMWSYRAAWRGERLQKTSWSILGGRSFSTLSFVRRNMNGLTWKKVYAVTQSIGLQLCCERHRYEWRSGAVMGSNLRSDPQGFSHDVTCSADCSPWNLESASLSRDLQI